MNVQFLFSRLLQSSLVRRFFTVTFWSVFGSIISNGFGLLMSIFVARLLGRQEFGQYVTIQTTLVLGTAICWFGIGFAVTRYCAEFRIRDPLRLGRILGMAVFVVAILGGLSVLVIVVLADWLAEQVFKAPGLALHLRLISIAIIFNVFDGFNKNALIGLSEMRAFAMASIYSICLGFPTTLLLTYHYGLIGAVSALVVVALLNLIISGLKLRVALKKFGIGIRFDDVLGERGMLANFAAPGLISGLLPALSTWLVQAFLIGGAGGYAEVALLGISMQWFHIVNFLPATTARTLMPMLTDAIASKDRHSSHRIFLLGLFSCTASAFPVALLGSVFASGILRSYGHEFGDNFWPLAITMAAGVLNGAQTPVLNLIAAKSEMWVGAAMAALQTGVYVIGAYFLASSGALGVCIAFAMGYLIQAIWSLTYGWSHFSGANNLHL